MALAILFQANPLPPPPPPILSAVKRSSTTKSNLPLVSQKLVANGTNIVRISAINKANIIRKSIFIDEHEKSQIKVLRFFIIHFSFNLTISLTIKLFLVVVRGKRHSERIELKSTPH